MTANTNNYGYLQFSSGDYQSLPKKWARFFLPESHYCQLQVEKSALNTAVSDFLN